MIDNKIKLIKQLNKSKSKASLIINTSQTTNFIYFSTYRIGINFNEIKDGLRRIIFPLQALITYNYTFVL
jgi:hypothetical protein